MELNDEMQLAAQNGENLTVVRCHEGKVDFLGGTLNAEKTHITFQSAHFSTYAVVAMDSVVTSAKTFDGITLAQLMEQE